MGSTSDWKYWCCQASVLEYNNNIFSNNYWSQTYWKCWSCQTSVRGYNDNTVLKISHTQLEILCHMISGKYVKVKFCIFIFFYSKYYWIKKMHHRMVYKKL